MLWDNAKARHALTDTLATLGIGTGHPRPYHPQTCGKIERFHQTLKRYLAAHDPAPNLTALQAHLDRFRHLYNHQRPHRALGRRIPAHVWNTTPKSGPATAPLNTPTTIRHITVDRTGVVAFGRSYSIIIGRRYAGSRATVIATGRACHVFIDGRPIRSLTLDPTRRIQPLNPTTTP